jgi:hypothetical protein
MSGDEPVAHHWLGDQVTRLGWIVADDVLGVHPFSSAHLVVPIAP